MNEILKKILYSITILLFFIAIAYVCRRLINSIAYKERNRSDIQKKSVKNVDILYEQIATIVFYFIIFIGIAIILPLHGVQSQTMIAILGTIGLGIGLSSQGVLNNIWCGVIIIMNDIYKIDDVLKLRIKDVSPDGLGNYIIGKVKSVNLFYTKLSDVKTNEEISVPNSLMYNSIGVTNNQSIIYE